jgi:SAM-dependent methyltransferase
MYPLEAVALRAIRRRLIPRASGDVLELGAGTGVNLAYYDAGRIRTLTVSDRELSQRLRQRARAFGHRAGLANGRLQLRELDAHSLGYPDGSFDTVVVTHVFCSVADPARALAEVRRVLRPRGRLVFIEHVRPDDPTGHLVDRVNPVWHAATGECNINRDTAQAIERAGLRLHVVRRSGHSFLVHGVAVKPSEES